MATQIYVVVSQENPLSYNHPSPQQAFSDYPSALTYAQSIFSANYGSPETARDLIYMIPLAPAPTTSPSSSATPTSSAA